jgi:hypothetical protein
MTHADIDSIQFGSDAPNRQIIETHISWVILEGDFAWKIKKPVRFSFLDFSTLPLRKHYCEREVSLNRRLTDIYLDVIPLFKSGNYLNPQGSGDAVEYAVRMKRLPPERQMHLLLEQNLVQPADVIAIADQLAVFHQKAAVIDRAFEETAVFGLFEDLASIAPFLEKHLEAGGSHKMEAWISLAKMALKKLSPRMQERVEEGFIRDGHGDLHAGNIFLIDAPVIFDCIEFNDRFRENDVLDEIAFLAMDLAFHGAMNLKNAFVNAYQERHPCFIRPADEVVFQYYLLYRATVRLKVQALRLEEISKKQSVLALGEFLPVVRLFSLCERYAAALKRKL